MTETPAEKPTPAEKAVGGLTIIKKILAELATLQRPTTAAAVAALIVHFIPGTGLDTTELVAAVASVGVLDAALEKIVA